MEFTMKLNASPIEMIASGEKTIELRLNDEKRRQISVRDMIRFSDINDASRTLLTEVKELFVFDSFEALYKALPLTECGYIPDAEEMWKDGANWLFYMPWNDGFVFQTTGSGAAIVDIDGKEYAEIVSELKRLSAAGKN